MRILLSEHDLLLGNLVESVLAKWGHSVSTARNVNEVWSTFYEQDRPNLMVLDWAMPDMDGVELCRRIRGRTDEAYVYILMLCESEASADVAAGINAGADDYIVRPFDARQLKIRLRAGQRILDLKAQLAESERKLAFQSTRDAITGAWNQAVVLDFLKGEVNRARRHWTSLAVILASLDGLVEIRDKWGNPAYETAAKDFVARLRASIRSYDILGKHGEGDYLLILPGCSAEQAQAVFKRSTHVVDGAPFHTKAGTAELCVRLGVAGITNEQGIDASILVRSAEASLEKSKAAARKQVQPRQTR